MLRLKAVFFAVILISAIALIGANAEAAIVDSSALAGSKINGEFEVSVFKDGKWQESGRPAFDQFFREKTEDDKRK